MLSIASNNTRFIHTGCFIIMVFARPNVNLPLESRTSPKCVPSLFFYLSLNISFNPFSTFWVVFIFTLRQINAGCYVSSLTEVMIQFFAYVLLHCLQSLHVSRCRWGFLLQRCAVLWKRGHTADFWHAVFLCRWPRHSEFCAGSCPHIRTADGQ